MEVIIYLLYYWNWQLADLIYKRRILIAFSYFSVCKNIGTFKLVFSAREKQQKGIAATFWIKLLIVILHIDWLYSSETYKCPQRIVRNIFTVKSV